MMYIYKKRLTDNLYFILLIYIEISLSIIKKLQSNCELVTYN